MGECTSKSSANESKPQENPLKPSVTEQHLTIKKENIHLYYEIKEKLAEGGFGSVFSARSIKTNKSRAIKVINTGGLKPSDIDNLLNEANILKSTDHPNILRIYEVFKDRTHVYFVTELLRGGELFERIIKNGGLTETQTAKYMLQIVSAVSHMHSLNIVHRDLKPENILFESKKQDSNLKVIDFGTCRHFTKNSQMLERIGSIYYMAPEVVTGNYNEKCDIWSLGVIFYILLCGYPPFNGANDRDILMNIVKGSVSFEGKPWLKVSKPTIDLIKSMLQTRAVLRPTASEVFQNPWLQSLCNNEAPDRNLAKNTLKNLAKFTTTNQLQRAVLGFIASELLSQEEIEDLQKLFKKIDKDGNGFLSQEEIENATVEYPGIFSGNISEVLKRVDADQNGQINYSEFLTAATNWEKELSNERLQQAFSQFDKDGNGKLSIDELYEALGGHSGQNLQFLQLVKEADLNQDGELDLEEFVLFMKQERRRKTEVSS